MYEKINWKDYPSKDTPMASENLGHMDEGIFQNSVAIGTIERIGGISDGTIAGAIVDFKDNISSMEEDLSNAQNNFQREVEDCSVAIENARNELRQEIEGVESIVSNVKRDLESAIEKIQAQINQLK